MLLTIPCVTDAECFLIRESCVCGEFLSVCGMRFLLDIVQDYHTLQTDISGRNLVCPKCDVTFADFG